MKKNTVKNILTILGTIALFASCEKKPMEPKVIKTDRTVVIFMGADNNLDGNSDINLKDLVDGMNKVANRVVIYHDSYTDSPYLLTVEYVDNVSVLDTIESYEEENSSSPEVLTRVLNRAKELYPADDYGLFLWSHATGWLTTNTSFPSTSRSIIQNNRLGYRMTKTFGEDEHIGNGISHSEQMDVTELAEALPYHLEYIVVDACLMANIEVAYELKEKVNYLVASPVETWAEGMPYDEITPYLWGGEDDLKKMCDQFYNAYNDEFGAMISVVKLTALDDLADVTRKILNEFKSKGGDYTSWKRTDVIRYPLVNFSVKVFYDYKAMIDKCSPSDGLRKEFDIALSNALIYVKNTDYYYGNLYAQGTFSGISMYIPLNIWSRANTEYAKFKWAQDVYGL